MKKAFLILFFLWLNIFVQAQYINIRIFSTISTTSFIFSPLKGSYHLIASDTDTIAIFTTKDVVNFIQTGDSIAVKGIFNDYGTYSALKLIADNKYSYFRIKPIIPAGKERQYDDNLIIATEGKELKIINNVYLENYVAGVVESEGGPRGKIEYYKTQAIICRTYALQNLGRFYDDGYDLCDNVNYQVYFGRARKNYEIVEGTYATKDLILVDSTKHLITATFHANCGGETANSEDVWLKPLSYLRSVQDPYCTGFKHARWERTINRSKWIKFLKEQGFTVSSKDNFTQMMPHRKKYYVLGNNRILATTLRSVWKFRSSFFDIIDNGHKIIVKGKGYGHGAGLCQEGAMMMSKKHFTYSEILHFYYTNILIVNLFTLPQYVGMMTER
jgi:stage II sporulation protein D